jgi:hypothetical protein
MQPQARRGAPTVTSFFLTRPDQPQGKIEASAFEGSVSGVIVTHAASLVYQADHSRQLPFKKCWLIVQEHLLLFAKSCPRLRGHGFVDVISIERCLHHGTLRASSGACAIEGAFANR